MAFLLRSVEVKRCCTSETLSLLGQCVVIGVRHVDLCDSVAPHHWWSVAGHPVKRAAGAGLPFLSKL